jgi:hypothetical protein
MRFVIRALALALCLAACGSSSTSEPAAPATSGADAPAAGASSEPASDSCYVIRAGSEDGCWQSGAEACTVAGCAPDACACTEATSRNSCGC